MTEEALNKDLYLLSLTRQGKFEESLKQLLKIKASRFKKKNQTESW
jgi:hypothetical protein